MSIQETTQHATPLLPALVGTTPTILDLCLHYRFDADTLAFIAEVDRQVMHEMFGYRPVCRGEAQKVLAVLSELLAQTFTLDIVDIPLIEEREGCNGETLVL